MTVAPVWSFATKDKSKLDPISIVVVLGEITTLAKTPVEVEPAVTLATTLLIKITPLFEVVIVMIDVPDAIPFISPDFIVYQCYIMVT